MDINIYVNKKKINPLCQSAIDEYIKRLSPYCNMKILCAAKARKYTSGHSTAHFLLTNTTSTISSEDFARQINDLTSGGISRLNYYIGFSSDDLLGITAGNGVASSDADQPLNSFSICTVQPSDDMSALLLSEQIYRAYTILNNITYHK